MWAAAVGRMAGVKVPLVAMHHAYIVTERIEGIQVGTSMAPDPRQAVGGTGTWLEPQRLRVARPLWVPSPP